MTTNQPDALQEKIVELGKRLAEKQANRESGKTDTDDGASSPRNACFLRHISHWL